MRFDNDVLMHSDYRGPRRRAWAWGIAVGVLMIATGLMLTFLLASFLQWRAEARADNEAASKARIVRDIHNPARAADTRVGALR